MSPVLRRQEIWKTPLLNGKQNAGQPSKEARSEGRTIVFVDESGLSERPTRVKIWAPIRSPQIVAFLQALARQIDGPILIIWDGLPAHRGKLVRDYVESLDGQIALERLPAYAPELNPVEYLFGYAKQRELANLCVKTIDEVKRYAGRRLKSLQRRPNLITTFWQQAELAL